MNSPPPPEEKVAPYCDTVNKQLSRRASSCNTPVLLSTTTSPTRLSDLNSLLPTYKQNHRQSLSAASTKSINSTHDNALYDNIKSMHPLGNDSGVDVGVSKQSENIASEKSSKSKREIYKFTTDWLISSLAWSNKPGKPFQLALCSFIENYKNYVELVSLAEDSYDHEIQGIATLEHPYPATKVLWLPCPENYNYPPSQSAQHLSTSHSNSSLLATTADYLRLWRVYEVPDDTEPSSSLTNGFLGSSRSINNIQAAKSEVNVKLECLLNSNQGSKLCAPLTSFDWNDIDPKLIVTSSVDTTCALWDLEYQKMLANCSYKTLDTRSLSFDGIKLDSPQMVSGTLKTQLVAHDNQVYDVSFSRSGSGRDVIVSCSADQSVRLFDLRELSTSTVLYESSGATQSRALVRVSCSKQNEHLISTFAIDSSEILILDTRRPGRPVCSLKNHLDNVNSMSWAPHSSAHLCTASDDCQALIWDLSNLPNPIGEPLLAYRASGKINTISWSSSQNDWVAIGYGNNLELLRV